MNIDLQTQTSTTYLGPAVVLETTPQLEVRLEDAASSEVSLTLALAFPYQPQVGDRLLAIGQDHAHFGIGVLSGAAQSSLEFQGDVDLRAVGGVLNLRGDEGLQLEAPTITLRAQVLRTVAESVTETVDTAFRWAKELLSVRAGESRRIVHGEDYSQSERSVTLAKGTVKVDGDQLHLGH